MLLTEALLLVTSTIEDAIRDKAARREWMLLTLREGKWEEHTSHFLPRLERLRDAAGKQGYVRTVGPFRRTERYEAYRRIDDTDHGNLAA